MRSLFFLAGLALPLVDSTDIDIEFGRFAEQFDVAFATPEEVDARKEIFAENYRYIQETNAKGLSYQLAVNQFAHLTSAEFKELMGLKKQPEEFLRKRTGHLGTHLYSGAPLPDSIDWTTKGAVTPVKNQGGCGSCWAFSATGSLEGRYKIKHQKLVSFSEQQLVDCSASYGNEGCNGGLMDYAFQYIRDEGICGETDYPYTGQDDRCSASSCTPKLKGGEVTGYKDVANNTQALMEATVGGPVSVAVDAASPNWQFYRSGVYEEPCGTDLDHGVLLVGYGSTDGQEYWKVKNSWGGGWGHQGYIYLKRGGFGKEGQCGILTKASYPVLK